MDKVKVVCLCECVLVGCRETSGLQLDPRFSGAPLAGVLRLSFAQCCARETQQFPPLSSAPCRGSMLHPSPPPLPCPVCRKPKEKDEEIPICNMVRGVFHMRLAASPSSHIQNCTTPAPEDSLQCTEKKEQEALARGVPVDPMCSK